MKTIVMVIAETAGISYQDALRVFKIIEKEKLFDWSGSATKAEFDAVIYSTVNRMLLEDAEKKTLKGGK